MQTIYILQTEKADTLESECRRLSVDWRVRLGYSVTAAGSIRKWAKANNFSAAFISERLRYGEPTPRLLRALGLRRVRVF